MVPPGLRPTDDAAGSLARVMGHPLTRALAAILWALLVALVGLTYSDTKAALSDSRADRADLRKAFSEHRERQAATEERLATQVSTLTEAVRELNRRLERQEDRRP